MESKIGYANFEKIFGSKSGYFNFEKYYLKLKNVLLLKFYI